MERRAFLTGLLGVAGAAALAGVAQAAPIARTLGLAEDAKPLGGAQALKGGRTPDGTDIEQAQVSVRVGPGGSRYSRGYRRRSRTVCTTRRWRGRLVRSCRRVYW